MVDWYDPGQPGITRITYFTILNNNYNDPQTPIYVPDSTPAFLLAHLATNQKPFLICCSAACSAICPWAAEGQMGRPWCKREVFSRVSVYCWQHQVSTVSVTERCMWTAPLTNPDDTPVRKGWPWCHRLYSPYTYPNLNQSCVCIKDAWF